MTAAISEAREALKGVLWMLAGRSDFHGQFDVSSGGVLRSYLAAIFAIPVVAFDAAVHNALARAASGAIEPVLEPYSLAFLVVRFVAVWGYFPLLAALVTTIIGKRGSFAPWVVVHNWTYLLIVLVQAIPMALLVSGAPGPAEILLLASTLLHVYAYVRVAKAALDIPWMLGAAVGIADLVAWLLVSVAVSRAL